MQQKITEMIKESITKLRTYNTKISLRTKNIPHPKNDIDEGCSLLAEILKGPLFEDENGRFPECGTLAGEEAFEELRAELRKTQNLVNLLKGDISSGAYRKTVSPGTQEER